MVFASRGAWGASGRLENESCGEIAFKYTGVIMTGNASQVIPETSDDELVRRAKSGGLEAFEALTSRYEQRVYALAMRMLRQEQDAEDVTQQTFLSVLENLEGFRGSAREIPLSGMAAGAGPPISRAEASFAAWVLRIASHAALKIIRKRKGLNTVSLEEATEGSERLVERNEIRRLLDDALTRLDEKHRLVFLLRDVEGLSIHETAAALDLSEANVKVRLLRARLQLREELTRVLGDPERRLTRTHHQHE
jgi:RNA polymerase sigma-70 factor (ECF subfamily)